MATTPIVLQAPDSKVFQFPTPAEAETFEKSVQASGGEVVRLEPTVPTVGRNLYDIEQHLAALVDSVETVDPEEEQQFLVDFQAAMTSARDKRDRVAHFFANCEALIAGYDREIARLKALKGTFEGAIERMEGMVIGVIKGLGTDAKGKYQKLEGDVSRFSVRRNPASITILDEAAVPTRFKSVSVTLPAELWEALLDEVDPEFRGRVLDAVKRPDSAVSKTQVKEAIETEVPSWKKLLEDQSTVFAASVPGAVISAGTLRLVRE
jgi:hypothetical protein